MLTKEKTMKKAVIIGGNSGIGAEIKSALEKADHEVVYASRTSPVQVDVLEDEPNFPEVGETLDALIYCPGSINLKPFTSLKQQDFQHDLEVNYLGFLKTVKHYIKALRKGHGAVVAFSTVAVQTGMPFHASVAGAKGALEGAVRSLAAEYAPKVRFNAIAPSITDTPLAERLLRNEKQVESAAERHPLKRVGSPEDVAELAAFLCSEKSSWITGQIYAVDGGLGTLR
jgi:3-oxoacyl-[acyl-carrier protein] reductase